MCIFVIALVAMTTSSTLLTLYSHKEVCQQIFFRDMRASISKVIKLARDIAFHICDISQRSFSPKFIFRSTMLLVLATKYSRVLLNHRFLQEGENNYLSTQLIAIRISAYDNSRYEIDNYTEEIVSWGIDIVPTILVLLITRCNESAL